MDCQLLRYALAGGIAFFCDFFVMYTLVYILSCHYLLGAAAGFICGTVVNYWLSIKWVFCYRTHQSSYKEFISFTMIGVVGLCLTELLVWLFTSRGGVYPMFSKCLATVIVFFWNYFARSVILFRKTKNAV